MHLKKVRVIGFQSFADTGEIELQEGINLFIGQNNAGKSAFLRALRIELPDDRHRTPQRFLDFSLALPEIDFWIDLTGLELLEAILRKGSQSAIPVRASNPQAAATELHNLFTSAPLTVELRHHAGHAFSSQNYSSLGPRDPTVPPSNATVGPNGRGGYNMLGYVNNIADDVPVLIREIWARNTFFFNAERYAIGKAPHAHATRLDPSAANLPAVLHTLSGDRGALFQKLVEHLRQIFPTVGNLSVRPIPNISNTNEIRVWPTKEMSHPELSFPLSESGTGVAQAVAILTAIMTIEKAIIIIDEINSFLHPAAVKALLRIIQAHYAHHQYIISTHSPEVIAFSNCRSMHMIKRDGYESTIQPIDLKDVAAFREVAEHLGVAMADVFAADRIIWVEGQTEEICFPYLYNATIGALPHGLIMTSVIATGDFNAKRRDRALVYEIYQRLSAATSQLAVSVAFSFDAEGLTPEQMDKMKTDSNGLVHFLPRRHLESYLIDADAIAAFVNDRLSDGVLSITADIAAATIIEAANGSDFIIDDWKNDILDPNWQRRVDAAKLINSVCERLTECRLTFTKKHDSLFLLKHIHENKPERIKELSSYVEGLVPAR